MIDWKKYTNIQCYDFSTEDCGIVIGNSIVCDGYQKEKTVAIFSHFHMDHVKDFQKTLHSCDTILASKITYEAIIALFGSSVSYRQNFQSLDFGQSYVTETGEKITLYPSNHIPGSAQVFVEMYDGIKILYSSDFYYPGITIPKCDVLVLDATHGDPQFDYVTDRKSVKNRIFEIVENEIENGKPITIKVARGTMQLVMEILENSPEGKKIPTYVKFLTNETDKRLTAALNPFLETAIRPLLSIKEKDTLKILNGNEPYIHFRGPGSNPIRQEETMRIIQIDMYSNFKDKGAIFEEEDGRTIRVNMSAHSSFSNILNYVKDAEPKIVLTDSSRSAFATTLANQISKKLGITTFAIPSR